MARLEFEGLSRFLWDLRFWRDECELILIGGSLVELKVLIAHGVTMSSFEPIAFVI